MRLSAITGKSQEVIDLAEQRDYPRAKLKWYVEAKSAGGTIDGVTLSINPDGAFISCPKPLRLNEVFDMAMKVPGLDRQIMATAEVVWSNIYGPNDEITPRGMGVRFVSISGQDRTFIAKASLDALKTTVMDPTLLRSLETLIIDLSDNE